MHVTTGITGFNITTNTVAKVYIRFIYLFIIFGDVVIFCACIKWNVRKASDNKLTT